jgi:valyl-tRNA synthetase
MLGDTAVAVHPGDERWADLIGGTVTLPLVDREIPVVADEHVDREFGTGAVKVTPAHDPNDWEIAQRHDLPAIDILTETAHVNAEGGRFEGMDRYAAREAVKAAFAELGLLGEVENRPHAVGHCYRCGTEVEPRLSLQWFVRTQPLAAKAMDAVRTGETKIVPERYAKEFFTWMENIRDWCVSRQIWWGHRIPAWYCGEGHVVVAREEPGACPDCGGALRQDEDVLDTWFSSGLWPLSTLGWPGESADLEAFYPTSVLVTGYDILFFWVARMMMFGCHFRPPTPFRVVALHGMVRDANGRKMSKSFGNVINPIDLMERYGTDATRFALLRGANPGGDVPLAEEWVEGARNFANKLWNAGRFVLSMLPAGVTPAELPERDGLGLADRWLLSRLERTRAAATAAYEDYDPAEATRLIFAFTWSELADWAIELAKPRLWTDGEIAVGQDAARAGAVLAYALDTVVRLLHPVMPFVTEELGRALTGAETITTGPWPSPRPDDVDPEAEAEMAVLQEAVTVVRRFRAEHQVPPSRKPELRLVPADAAQAKLFTEQADALASLARLGAVAVESAGGGEAPDGTAKLLAAGAELYLPLAGMLDIDAELVRLGKERERLAAELTRAEAKLANPAFVEKAPEPVVAKSRARVTEVTEALAKVDAQRAELGG